MALESVVRPFQTKNLYANTRISTTPKEAKGGRAHLCWGSVGTKPTPTPAGTDVEMNDCNESNSELKGRDSETMRIENPDDTSQYVMVRRPKTMLFKHTDKRKNSWQTLSDVAADVAAWQSEMDAIFSEYDGDTAKCKMKMTLKPPNEDASTSV